MNTSKQINIMVVLIFLSLVVFGAYTIWDPIRADEAEEVQSEKAADFGAKNFALNCRLCHGDAGQGGAAGGRLPQALPLDRPDLQGFVSTDFMLAADVGTSDTAITLDGEADFEVGDTILIDKEKMRVVSVEGNLVEVERGIAATRIASHSANTQVLILDEAKLMESEKLIINTITCGRVGTAMPLWSDKQGGSLNDEQIRQLMVLITTGRWDLAEEHALEGDLQATGEIHLVEDISSTATEIPVEDTSPFREGDPIRIDDERMIVQAVKESSLVVERGALNSEAAEHAAGVLVRNQAQVQAPVNPSILQSSCGQFIRGPVPTAPAVAGPAPTPAPPPEGAQEVTVKAIPVIQFDTDEIRVKPGTISVTLINEDTGVPHNWAVYTDESASEAIAGANENICNAPCEATVTFEINEPGTYFFRCDVHPTVMVGKLIVEE